jgi:hypothetical protein
MKKRMMVVAVLTVAVVLGVVAYALAANPETVTVKATPNALLQMSVTTNTVDFGSLNPETWSADSVAAVTCQVKSNKKYNLVRVINRATIGAGQGNIRVNGFLAGAAGLTDNHLGAGTHDYADDYAAWIPFEAPDGTSVTLGTVVYTATQY